MIKKYKPFYARVGNVLDISPLFFTAGTSAIVRELAQNARRAGATTLDIKHLSSFHNVQGTGYLVFTDNGGGCEPEDLMGFADSGWGSDIKSSETPAGIGFWSLANRGATVRCGRGWIMELEKRHFTGELPIQPRECEPEEGLGLEITAGIPAGTRASYCEFKHYPFARVDVDREKAESNVPFLADTLQTYKFPGYDIQIKIKHKKTRADAFDAPGGLIMKRGDLSIIGNYNGHILTRYVPERRLPAYGLSVDRKYCRPEVDWVKIHVNSEKALPPTLPQRDAIQEGEEFDKAMEDVLAVYEMELDRLFEKENVWRSDNDKWAGCLLLTDLSEDSQGICTRMRPTTVEEVRRLAAQGFLPMCLDADESTETTGLVLDAMTAAIAPFEVFSIRDNALIQDDAFESGSWQSLVYPRLIKSVSLKYNDNTEHDIDDGQPLCGLPHLRAVLLLESDVFVSQCLWFIPFHYLWMEFKKKGEVDITKLMSPALLISNRMLSGDYAELETAIEIMEDNAKALEKTGSFYWGSERRPSEAIAEAMTRLIDNFKDPLHALENSLKAAVDLACRRLPRIVWDLVSSAVITVDSQEVKIELKPKN